MDKKKIKDKYMKVDNWIQTYWKEVLYAILFFWIFFGWIFADNSGFDYHPSDDLSAEVQTQSDVQC